jgi:hypothetical protein
MTEMFYSIWDLQCNKFFSSGKNSESMLKALEDCAEMLTSDSEEIVDIMAMNIDDLKSFVEGFETELVEHDVKIPDEEDKEMQENQILQDKIDYAWHTHYSYNKKNMTKEEWDKLHKKFLTAI